MFLIWPLFQWEFIFVNGNLFLLDITCVCGSFTFDRHISMRMTLFFLSTHHTLSLEVSTHGLMTTHGALVVVQHQGTLQGNASPAETNDSYTWPESPPPSRDVTPVPPPRLRKIRKWKVVPASSRPRPAQQCQVSCGRIRRSR